MPSLNCDGILFCGNMFSVAKKDIFLPLLFYDDKNGRVW